MADGASYEPATGQWEVLPVSPLSARAAALSVWTGRQLLIWGGQGELGDALHDGAAYTPATGSWSRLPTVSDGTGRVGSRALVWTGSAAVLLTGDSALSAATTVNARLLHPGDTAWTSLPPLHLAEDHPMERLSAVAAGNQVWAWAKWSRTTVTARNSAGEATSFDSLFGIDVYRFDLHTQRWTAVDQTLAAGQGMSQPWWTGTHLLIPAGPPWWGPTGRGPVVRDLHGVLVDAVTGRTVPLPHGPVDDLQAHYLWAGTMLIGVDSAAAAWDSTSGEWTTLPAPPDLTEADPVMVWTGHQLIIWANCDPLWRRHHPHLLSPVAWSSLQGRLNRTSRSGMCAHLSACRKSRGGRRISAGTGGTRASPRRPLLDHPVHHTGPDRGPTVPILDVDSLGPVPGTAFRPASASRVVRRPC
ncbi:hypothetical protein GCM10011594_12980 [Nakamurella endophytica]|uniref:Galactose oxidase n=2 Tax=Nakamurella endophytica TaxID=1748367 RepID=A0A917SRY2_9ACTN|nr:hypothetical protein GCM10011594_12980 [Nakamurella endophytica]